ncbi:MULTISPECIES: IclR family transcriptional regulator [unclassified Sulfitobacter]|uniref:IclR family transcriptional regulator n=1 Tax=unclassified Sulfitobacter TaxID=196795 RepID=UPI0037459A41
MARQEHNQAKSGPSAKTRRDPPRSINRLLGIFERIAEVTEVGMTLADLSVALDAPKSSLLIMLRPLVDQDYLIHESNTYRLGPRMFQFASAILANSRFSSLVRHHMTLLRDWTDETVIYATLDLDSRRIVYEDVVEGSSPIRYVVNAGANRPAYPTASGRVLIGHAPTEWQNRYFADLQADKLTSRTITDIAGIQAAVKECRQRGVCFTNGEAIDGAAGVSAPVRDRAGEVIGVLVLGAPRERGVERRELYERKTVDAADRLSVAIGYRPPS